MDTIASSHGGFFQRRLPWLVALGALVVYLVTLVRWESPASMPHLAKIADWDWRLQFHAPLQFLVTYPIRWLPATWQLVCLNLLSALCGAATVGLLARCVALLPHDRTKEQRQLERSDYSLLTIKSAWIPPLFAAMVCGLQLTFWEFSVAWTGELFSLLLFAIVIWNLLEFRLDERDRRLYAAAAIYGLAITDNYAMIGFFPAFVAAVIWVKGLAFFSVRFLTRIGMSGMAGLLLYWVLPLIVAASNMTHLGVWEALLINLGFQKSALLGFPRYLFLIMSLTSLVPILFIGIRWPASVGDISVAGATLTRLMTFTVHAAFLVTCTYIAFDPVFSPRSLGGGLAFLPLYFLGALSVGYFTGYFLLICRTKDLKPWERPNVVVRVLNRLFVWAIWIALPVLPALLVAKNYPLLKKAYRKGLDVYGQAALESLPQPRAVILCDDTLRLSSLQHQLTMANPNHPHILVDTASMNSAAYHRWQHLRFPEAWPNTLAERPLHIAIPDPDIVEFVVKLAEQSPLMYVHPSFGYYFEKFYARPRQFVYELHRLEAGSISGPASTESELSEQAVYWNALYEKPEVQGIVRDMAQTQSQEERVGLLQYYGRIFSMHFNEWGTRWQKAGKLNEAADLFVRALALNPDNPTAFVNQDFNRYLKAPTGPLPGPSQGAVDRLKLYGSNWNRILGANGPVDEPNSCFLLAQSFLQGNNFVQAAQQLQRALALNTELYLAQISLAGVFLQLGQPERVFEVLKDLRARTKTNAMPLAARMKILEVEAWAQVASGNLQAGEQLLQAAQTEHPDQNEPFSTLASIYLSNGRQADAVGIYRRQLELQPNNVPVLVNLAALLIFQGQYEEALPMLNRAVSIEPRNQGALINRAIAHLNVGQLGESQRDYQTLLTIAPKPIAAAVYGLAEIAWKQKNYPEALRQYERFLGLARPGTREIPVVESRIQTIKSGSL